MTSNPDWITNATEKAIVVSGLRSFSQILENVTKNLEAPIPVLDEKSQSIVSAALDVQTRILSSTNRLVQPKSLKRKRPETVLEKNPKENAPKFTLLGNFESMDMESLQKRIAAILNSIGVYTTPSEVHIPEGQDLETFSTAEVLHRVSFQIGEQKTIELKKRFVGDRCELMKHKIAGFPMVFHKDILMKELSDWDVVRLNVLRHSIHFLQSVFKPSQRYIITTCGTYVRIFKERNIVATYSLKVLTRKHKAVFENAIALLTKEGQKMMREFCKTR